jgi:monovalent cation/proton antiporter MnhG/PhaG subunit
MSSLFMDSLIFLLLVLSIVFGGIGVIGLLLFPDIRSRMYTATRASLISVIAITVSVIVYALFILSSGGGSQYGTLILHTLVLLMVVVAANMMMYQTIAQRIHTQNTCEVRTGQKNDDDPEK